MSLNRKITLLLVSVAIAILLTLVAISLYAFRALSIVSSTAQVRTAAEIVRVHLTEAMINGTIDKRAQALERLREIRNLMTVRVVRSAWVNRQFGVGLAPEMVPDEIETRVLADGKARFELREEAGETVFRGTVPYIASAQGKPNCLQCHQVQEGTVLGTVTIELSLAELKQHALYSVLAVLAAVGVISLFAILGARRLILPVGDTAAEIGAAVQNGLRGDFRVRIVQRTHDDIGQIAFHINSLFSFLEDGLARIGERVTHLTGRAVHPDENRLQATVEMVEALTAATRFKALIEEDETKLEIYGRFGRLLTERFGVRAYSFYETQGVNQLVAVAVDGVLGGACRWCDPEILVRAERCRAKRSGHVVDGLQQPEICFAFRPAEQESDAVLYVYYCIPLIQSGTVGSVVQLLAPATESAELRENLPYIQVYVREMTPVLEAKRLTDSLREASLHDALTGLNNRRFLEEYIDTLVASVRRHNNALALLMVDLDYFKVVNDTYGHDVGDVVIKGLAELLRKSLRGSDLLIRFGGEEFLIVLQDTDNAAALDVAEKIRARVADYKFQVNGGILQKTLSIGVALFPEDGDTFWQVVKFADVALYRAKEEGRNRVVRFLPQMWASGDVY